MAIVILVTFGTENRILSTEQNNVRTKVRDLFHIPQEYDIKLQRFCKEWDEWLTIDESEINNRDKIRVQSCINMDITMPITSDPLPGGSSSIFSSTLGETLDNDLFTSMESDAEGVKTSEQANSVRETSPHHTGASTSDVKRAAGRVKLEAKQWPLNVTIPRENLSPQLRSTLEKGLFPTDKQRRQLIQVLYDYMLQFGRYPSRFHYEQVAQQLIKEYPCLAQNNIPSAKPYDYWKLKLSDKFRNERKNMTDVDGEEKRRKVRKVSHPPEGEDQGSILTHVKWMQEESKKKTPDWKQVKGLMEVTFKERRSDISNKMMVQDIKKKYPFLFSITEIHNEFERITGVVGRTSMTKNLRQFFSEILNFSFKDKLSQDFVKTVVAKKLEEAVTMEKAEEIKLTAALYLMPSLFKKKQSTIMGTGEGCTEVNPAPFLFINNDNIFEAETFRIGCEQVEICKCTSLLEGVVLLVESLWVFDVQYPKATKDIYNFMECCLLKLKAVKPTRGVFSVLTKFSASD